MNKLNVIFTYVVNNYEECPFEFEFEGSETAQDVKESIVDSISDDKHIIDPDDIILTSFECVEDIHEDYNSLDGVFDYAEIFCQCEYTAEVVNAAIDCGINASDIDEAYSGEFSSDEEFAQDMAEQTGAIDLNSAWPHNCIDWEWAARELMYDYTSSDGHYFRNF